MAADGSIIIDTSIDNDGLEKDLKGLKSTVEKSTKTTKGLGDEFDKVSKKGKKAARDVKDEMAELEKAIGDVASTLGLSFGLDTLVNFGQAAVEAASDLQEVQNVVDTAFGDMSAQVEEFSQNSIKQFGMSELAAKQTAGRYMAMTTSMGITGQAATDMALEITALTGDMASFYNVSQDVASTALASIWTGETESLKQFGIVMTQTNLEAFALSQGINKTWNELTQAEQVQLRYNYVLAQTTLAQGDFAKTSDGWANQNRILDETVKALSASIGEDLMDTLSPFLGIINEIVGALLEFQESTGLLDDFFLTLTAGVAGLLALKAAEVIKRVATAVMSLSSATLMAKAQAGIAAIAIGALVVVIAQLAQAWGSMTDGERVVAILGAVAAAALTAAVAVGAFQSALTLGIAAAAIVAGIAAVYAAISSAEKRMQKYQNMEALGLDPNAAGRKIMTVPKLATGAVIPPNQEFMAILGDQRHGNNIEAPEGLIRQIVREESGGINGVLTVRPAPGFTRHLYYELEVEKSRAGTPLVEGARR